MNYRIRWKEKRKASGPNDRLSRLHSKCGLGICVTITTGAVTGLRNRFWTWTPRCLRGAYSHLGTYPPKLLLRTLDRTLGIFITKGGSSLSCLLSFSLCRCFMSSELYRFPIYLLYSISHYCLPLVGCTSCAVKSETQSFIDFKGRRMSWRSQPSWSKWALNFHLCLNQTWSWC